MRQLTENLHKLLEKAVSEHTIAGANLLILKDGGEIAYAHSGWADMEAEKIAANLLSSSAAMRKMKREVRKCCILVLIWAHQQ